MSDSGSLDKKTKFYGLLPLMLFLLGIFAALILLKILLG